MNEILGMIEVLFTPSCWIVQDTYSESWDLQLTILMKTQQFEDTDRYESKIGGFTVWTANHPYASFTTIVTGNTLRPRRITALRAGRKMVKDNFERNAAGRDNRGTVIQVNGKWLTSLPTDSTVKNIVQIPGKLINIVTE